MTAAGLCESATYRVDDYGGRGAAALQREEKRKMDQHLMQQQQQQQQQHYVDPYRAVVLSPQNDPLHTLQYNHHQPPLPSQATPPLPQATPPPPQHHHASLASHFHLLHLMTRLADAIGKGSRDQNSDALVEDLTSQFARCQQLLNSISGTLSSKSITVEGQRKSLEETQQLLDQRKDLITKYRSSVEGLLKGDTTR
ncbi:hypothetical protein GUJ93_ZPchr0001g30292 [Zizania palustris]|uniref:Mediator of RNA polymerase II transcription subunit 9 n=2 Tax=Zizania palustris TaxID=103762 RepID=A0A8J5S8A7_ZIZPA|nr:hypothetical protein GUJ93_ZPchr0001g30292 [Zizania palustris]